MGTVVPIVTSGQRLRPCPFCGGGAEFEKTRFGRPVHYWVKCTACGAGSSAYASRRSAVEAWNTRPLGETLPASVLLEALKAMVRANDSAVTAMMECDTEEGALEIARQRGEAFSPLIEVARAAIAQAEAA